MDLQSLTDLLVHELRDIYDAEQQAAKALPQMAEKAFSPELRELFEEHLTQTQGQIERLETIFAHLKMPAKGVRCQAMAGLIAEAEELLEQEDDADPSVLDAGMISAAQKMEHYEIAGYGCARTYARTLKAGEVARLLQQTLDEEELTDRKLTALAESTVNLDAAETDKEILAEASR